MGSKDGVPSNYEESLIWGKEIAAMAKFKQYYYRAENQDGNTLAEGKVTAQSRESAWMKAVAAAFDAIEANTGEWPEQVHVSRVHSPSESDHG